jgi:hypothetical protein
MVWLLPCWKVKAMPFTYFNNGLNLQDGGQTVTGVSVLNFANGILGVSGTVATFSAPVPQFTIEKGDTVINNPAALSIVSGSATLASVSTLPVVVQYASGIPHGLTLENPVTVGNLLVFLNTDGLTALGFNQIYSLIFPGGDEFSACEKIATSPASPVITTNQRNQCLLMEISGCVRGTYTPEAITSNTGGVCTVDVNATFNVAGITLLLIRADNSYASAPFQPAGVIPIDGGGYNANAYLINPASFTSGEIVFSSGGLSDATNTVFAFYGANPANVTAQLTI